MKQFDALDAALDAVSWEWLEQAHPVLAQALIREVQRGAQPGDIKRHVQNRTFRYELALRCEQAARFLVSEQGDACQDIPNIKEFFAERP